MSRITLNDNLTSSKRRQLKRCMRRRRRSKAVAIERDLPSNPIRSNENISNLLNRSLGTRILKVLLEEVAGDGKSTMIVEAGMPR